MNIRNYDFENSLQLNTSKNIPQNLGGCFIGVAKNERKTNIFEFYIDRFL